MTHDFDTSYWDEHWRPGAGKAGDDPELAANPHLVHETADLGPGTALDAGCGAGAEALWLAARGWRVTGVDISTRALDRAAARAERMRPPHPVTWVEADLTTWEPPATFDLVTTHYAHSTLPQLALYARLARWVAPGGTLLVVGHLSHGHHPAEASVSPGDIAALFPAPDWRLETAREDEREVPGHDGPRMLRDTVVRVTRAV